MKLRMIRTERQWRATAERRSAQLAAVQIELAQTVAQLVTAERQVRDLENAARPRPVPRFVHLEWSDGYREQVLFNGNPAAQR